MNLIMVYAVIALRRICDTYNVSLLIVKVQDSFCEQLLLHFVTYPNILYIIDNDKQQKIKIYVPCAKQNRVAM